MRGAVSYTIPRLASIDDPGPGWRPVVDGAGNQSKPHIKCGGCGHIIGISRHHVHADGTVTPSVWHDPGGCDWHFNIKLADYDQGEFPPAVAP